MGTGWVCFQAGAPAPAPNVLPELLNHAITTWLQRNVEFRVKAVLPVIVEGNTVAVHVWLIDPAASVRHAGKLPLSPVASPFSVVGLNSAGSLDGASETRLPKHRL